MNDDRYKWPSDVELSVKATNVRKSIEKYEDHQELRGRTKAAESTKCNRTTLLNHIKQMLGKLSLGKKSSRFSTEIYVSAKTSY